jgi:hypothetical protein
MNGQLVLDAEFPHVDVDMKERKILTVATKDLPV